MIQRDYILSFSSQWLARECGLSLAGTAGSNPAGGMVICLF